MPPIEASCHCGAVRIKVDRPPDEVTDCNCSICRRYGVLWAYYDPNEVQGAQAASTHIYLWDDQSIAFHRCAVCGCVTHWAPVDTGGNRMGINARLLDPAVLARAHIRHLDGAVTEQYLD